MDDLSKTATERFNRDSCISRQMMIFYMFQIYLTQKRHPKKYLSCLKLNSNLHAWQIPLLQSLTFCSVLLCLLPTSKETSLWEIQIRVSVNQINQFSLDGRHFLPYAQVTSNKIILLQSLEPLKPGASRAFRRIWEDIFSIKR